jgi:hypothetical protein
MLNGIKIRLLTLIAGVDSDAGFEDELLFFLSDYFLG